MRLIKLTYILSIIAMLVACRQTKYVPEGKYLLKKNKIEVADGKLDEDEITSIIRQKPNFKTVGFKAKLMVYNMFDSTSVANKRFKKNISIREKNAKKQRKEDRINTKRIEKSRKKDRSVYTQKIIPLLDTVAPKMFLREWFKYKIGEVPVVFDSLSYNKSIEQLNLFLKNRGYYYGTAAGSVKYKRNRKAVITYELTPRAQYMINSVYIVSSNSTVKNEYANFVKKQEKEPLVNEPFDSDVLNSYRNEVAKHMRDNALYGFSSSHITYIADTNKTSMTVKLGIEFSDRMVRSENNRDSLVKIPHKITYVKDVYFHIADTLNFKGNFKKTVEDMGLILIDQQFLRTIDTFVYAEILKHKTDELDIKRIATFLYNGEISISPGLLEAQNYLEKENYYKEYYLERSYTRLLQLGLFQAIKPIVKEIPGTKYVEVHYYLMPAKKQTFGFEPRFTNSNGFLGVASSINYTNKNLFGGAEKMTFSIGGGFESQPPIFDKTLDGETIKQAGRSFNTFEIGPSLKFDLPGLFPTKVTALSKRQRPRTVISAAYNFQKRADFTRQVFQMNYLWRFYVSKTQIFQAGLPFASVIKFVRIENSPEFEAKLNLLNDLFLRNAYSNQFIWQDWKLTLEYNNKDKDNKTSKYNLYLTSTFDPAGNTLSLFKSFQDTLDNGQRTIFGVGYSQFARLDNEMIYSLPIGKKRSIHARIQAGGGMPYGNTTTSLPFDYSFFAGGANDNRGWKARALGPGSYKYYLDTNRTATQIGDIRFGGSFEFRFSMGSVLKGAVFVDAGNVWTFNDDVNRPGSKFSGNWYKEIALATGFGLRMDLDFFILRLDLGLPLTNPALPDGARWFFQPRDAYIAEGIAEFGTLYEQYLPRPFIPQFHFGIGYPF